MKKTIFLLLAILSASLTCGQDKQKLAVYVTASDGVMEETRKIIGSELVAAIALNDKYSAVERTSEFLTELGKEQGYQRTGNVDDSQISKLGKQFGVSVVCIAEITPYDKAYYIQARFINVENALIMSTARVTSNLRGLDEVVRTAESLATKLIGSDNLQGNAKKEPELSYKKLSYDEFKAISKKERLNLLQGNILAQSAYKSYKSKKVTGWMLMGAGATALIIGATIPLEELEPEKDFGKDYGTINGILAGGGGAVMLSGAIVLLSNSLKKTYNFYVRGNNSKAVSLTATPIISPNNVGFGLRLVF